MEPELQVTQPTDPLSHDIPEQLPPSKNKKKWWIISAIVVLVILVLVVLAAYVVFAEGKTSFGTKFQDAMWSDVIDANDGIHAIDANVSVTYQDNGTFSFVPSDIAQKAGMSALFDPTTLQQYDKQFSFTLNNLKQTTTLSGFFNDASGSQSLANLALNADLVNGPVDYNGTLDAKNIGNDSYLKYDYNQAVADSSLFAALGSFFDPSTDKGVWLKTQNVDQLTSVQDATSLTPQQIAQIQALMKANRPVTIQSFKGFASIDGQETAHYALTVDKPQIRAIIAGDVRIVDPSISQSDSDYYMQFVDSALAKTNFQDFEVWVGLKDHRVYKSAMQSNAISLTNSLTYLEQNMDTIRSDVTSQADAEQARDASRMSYAQELQSDLQSYDLAHGGYPAANHGVPVGITNMPAISIAPTPADGQCNTYYNNYWYSPTGTPESTSGGVMVYPSYTFTFCIGSQNGSFQPGVLKMTPEGIAADPEDTAKLPPVSTTAAVPSASVTPVTPQAEFLKVFQALPYSAQVNVSYSANSYNVTEDVQPPATSKDISSQGQSSTDTAAPSADSIPASGVPMSQ